MIYPSAARVLRRFAAFADREGADYITVDLFLRWKAAFGTANNNTWSARLGMVRIFATWLQGHDARTEVPPAGLISGKLRADAALHLLRRRGRRRSSRAPPDCRPDTA